MNMLFPVRRVVAIVIYTLIFSTKQVNGQDWAGDESSDCDKSVEESECNLQWSCEWQYDEEGNGYCASMFPSWVFSLITIVVIGCYIFCFCYWRYQRRRRQRRVQAVGRIHQPVVELQPVRNPVPPSVSPNPHPPAASYVQQPNTQQPHMQPYNQAYGHQGAYNPQATYKPPPSFSTEPPPPAYEPDR